MKKVWNTQTNEPIYVMDEKALHNRILSKQTKARHTANISELMAIISYLFAGMVVSSVNYSKEPAAVSLYLLSVWMIISGLYLLRARLQRNAGEGKFDRSMQGDLLFAISIATYQVRLSQLVRWNILPIGILIAASMLEGGKPVWSVLVLIFLAITAYASGWEHNIYKSRKKELEGLYRKLSAEETILH